MAAPRVPLDVGVLGTGRVGAVLGAALATAGHRVVGASGVSAAIATPRRAAAAGGAAAARRSGRRRRRPRPGRRARRRAARPGRRPGQHRRLDRGADRRAHLGRARHRRARSGGRARGRPARPAPGDDVHRTPRRPRPAGRHALRDHRAGRDASRSPKRSSSNSAANRSGCPNGPARSTTRRLAIGSNYLVTLVNESIDLLEDAGVESPARLVAPLLSAALDNALRLRDAALTGPISRGDAATVALHVATLRARGAGRAAALRRARAAHRRAGAGGGPHHRRPSRRRQRRAGRLR